MERRVTPPRRVTSPTWGPPPQCKQTLNKPRNKSDNFPKNANSNVILFLSNHAILSTPVSQLPNMDTLQCKYFFGGLYGNNL